MLSYQDAYKIAAEVHAGQKDKAGGPYIDFLQNVADYLKNKGESEEVQTLAMAVQADGLITDLMHPIGHHLDTCLGDVREARSGFPLRGLGGINGQQCVLRARREVDLVDVRTGEDLLTEGAQRDGTLPVNGKDIHLLTRAGSRSGNRQREQNSDS